MARETCELTMGVWSDSIINVIRTASGWSRHVNFGKSGAKGPSHSEEMSHLGSRA